MVRSYAGLDYTTKLLANSEAAAEDSVNWHDIAAQVPGRSNKDCRKRWVYALAPNITKGSWEPDEDDRLRAGVRLHNTK
jgi:hypothetical protein